jgi:hypothetical protein
MWDNVAALRVVDRTTVSCRKTSKMCYLDSGPDAEDGWNHAAKNGRDSRTTMHSNSFLYERV